MRLLELFLIETTEEDRAIISLSSAIFQYIQKYKEPDIESEPSDDIEEPEEIPDYAYETEESTNVGKIGKIVDTPLEALRPVKIRIDSDLSIRKDIKNSENLEKLPARRSINAYWDPNIRTIILNKEAIDQPEIRSGIAHELRHALDDYKSEFKASGGGYTSRYFTPKKKEFRGVTDDPYMGGDVHYLARPAEINARFVETLNSMVPIIKRAVQTVEPERLRSYILKQFKDALLFHEIAHLFPEKEKSRDYKRLVKRGVDFIGKEVQHQLELQKKK